MKTLKEKIREKMVLTDEDKLIFEILGEHPNLSKYEKEGRRAFRKFVIETCQKCEKYYEKCNHYFEPVFTKDWKFKCFVTKEEK